MGIVLLINPCDMELLAGNLCKIDGAILDKGTVVQKASIDKGILKILTVELGLT